ncbi:MAG: hypothetical protein GX666_08620 [Tissierellia bacterium]|nr:hypothetical protein [Tissierellia bacterium]
MGNEIVETKKVKKSKLALVSLVLSTLYVIYLFKHFGGGIVSNDGAEAAGAAIASALVFPHAIMVLIGVIFNALGYFMNNRYFVLVGAILYAVSMVLFLLYFMFVIVQMILSFIAFAKMSKRE